MRAIRRYQSRTLSVFFTTLLFLALAGFGPGSCDLGSDVPHALACDPDEWSRSPEATSCRSYEGCPLTSGQCTAFCDVEQRLDGADCAPGCYADADCSAGHACEKQHGDAAGLCRACEFGMHSVLGECVAGCDTSADCYSEDECIVGLGECHPRCGERRIWGAAGCMQCPNLGFDIDGECVCPLPNVQCNDRCFAASDEHFESAECALDGRTDYVATSCREGYVLCAGRCLPLPSYALSATCGADGMLEIASCAEGYLLCGGRCAELPAGAATGTCAESGNVEATSCEDGYGFCNSRCYALARHADGYECRPSGPVVTSCGDGWELTARGGCEWAPGAVCPALLPLDDTPSSDPAVTSCPCPTGVGPHGEVYACDPAVNACASLQIVGGSVYYVPARASASERVLIADAEDYSLGRPGVENTLFFDESGRPVGSVYARTRVSCGHFGARMFTLDESGRPLFDELPGDLAEYPDTVYRDVSCSGVDGVSRSVAGVFDFEVGLILNDYLPGGEPCDCTPSYYDVGFSVAADCWGFHRGHIWVNHILESYPPGDY